MSEDRPWHTKHSDHSDQHSDQHNDQHNARDNVHIDAAHDEPWQRVLWKRQPFPDNYVPPSFLADLRTNTNFKPFTYVPLVLAACVITQHVASIFIFLAVFTRLYTDALDPRALVVLVCTAYVLGYATWELLDTRVQRRAETRAKALKSALLVFLALLALSPVLRTLTAATSSDSIWALAAVLFVLNALLADYGAQERLTSVLSMNAAISASAVLASRLPTNTAVFALTLFAVQLFALFPLLRARLQASPPPVRVLLTALLSALAVHLSAPLSVPVACLFALVLAMLTFIAPAVFVWAQRFKNEIRGPWDVAVPHVR